MLVNSTARIADYIAYILAELSFLFLVGNIFGVYWLIQDQPNTDPQEIDFAYPFNSFNWQVAVQAFLCLACILMFLSFAVERLVGPESGGYKLKCSVAGFWFSSMLCTVTAMSLFTGYTRNVDNVHNGLSYRLGWTAGCLNLVASLIYAFV